MCVAIWQWRKSRDEKSRFFYAYHLHSLSSRSFTRSFKKPHSGGGFFWRGFLVVLRKLLSNFHRKFANLEKTAVFASECKWAYKMLLHSGP